MKFPNEILPAYAIWINNQNQKDEYVDIIVDKIFKEGYEYILRIVCDTEKAVYLDENLISFGQYADFPRTPVYDDIRFTAKSESKLKITAWHSGIDSQTHVATQAYIAFCIFENDKLIYASSDKTQIGYSTEYIQHACKIITSQMGAGFSLDLRNSSYNTTCAEIQSIEIESLRKRPIKPLYLGKPIKGKIIRSGKFRSSESDDPAMLMKQAELDTHDNANGIYYLFDLGTESVGFPEIFFSTSSECIVYWGWGEHIIDGMCRTAIHSRRFSSVIYAKSGNNGAFPVLRRIGARYIQLFFTDVNVSQPVLLFHPVLLPVEVLQSDLKNDLRNKIRETAIHTLECCMHEHYEDCPWREQALYTLDSRNQMLAGYKVFKNGNAKFVRANLDLISRGVRDDGILSLCYPAGLDYPIPFYTLAYYIQMYEYIENTGDTSLASAKYDLLVSMLDVFYGNCNSVGLAKRFADSKGYWNFYEWSDHLSGDKLHKNTEDGNLPCEAILSAALSLASSFMGKICQSLGKTKESQFYFKKASIINKAVSQTFYNQKNGLFFDFTDRPNLEPSVLTQAMCLLSGAAEDLPKQNILQAISNNGGTVGGINIIPATLSMACFRYDALLNENKHKYSKIILDEIDRDGKYMLENGATAFWETLRGAEDFGGAGSLCHGWSAMAAYYYSILQQLP